MIDEMELEAAHTSGVYSKRPVMIVRGSGALLWDSEGREYIDCSAGHGVANIGHARPEVAAALAQQAQQLITCPESVYNDVRARLLARLARITPQGLEHIFLCNSGTEAVEAALKFARLATGRTGIVATLRGFHGRTMGALSATWERAYREPFAPLVPGVRHVRYNDLAAAEQAISDETACVLIELAQGEGGVHVATQEYVRGLAELCAERGALLIVDEVQTGFGRTGRLFTCEHYGLSPDILCLAKSMAGGVPMGAVCLGPRVMQSGRITRGTHGSTFGGNPLACAAALATLDVLEREHLPERAAPLGEHALERLRAMDSPLVREIRGLGLMIGIELRERAQPYLEELLERGVFALPAGPNVIRLLPPLVISEQHLDTALDIIAEVLGARQQAQQTNIRIEGVTPEQSAEVALLYHMLTIPSLSRQEGALARYMACQARAMGLDARVDEVGNMIATVLPSGYEGQPIVLLGHMDTVAGNIPVEIRDGLLYGRGAVDAKGPLAAFLCAAARVACSGELSRPVVVIGAVEEEAATSRGARAVVERYRPLACVIGEPSGSRAITIGYKGRLLVEYVVTRPLAHTARQERSSCEIATTFWQRVSSHAARWNEQHAGDSAFAALMPSLRNINSSQDGLSEQTRLLIGYRLPPEFDIAALREQLQNWAREDEASVTFTGEERAFQSSRATPLARAFLKAIRATGEQPTFKQKTGTSDMNVVGPVWGQNIVAYGPGDSRLDHTPNEHIRIDEYLHGIDVLTRVLKDLV
jgi:predicted acetylornithine/succinylornithine family transaminase/N-acetyl-ornithine/N-acetyl-lysine deacetylase